MSHKTLYLLRHAKAANAQPGQDDHERPLNTRGQENARRMGEYFKLERIMPSLALCSTALRTRQTLQAIEAVNGPLNVQFESRLYLAAPQDVLLVLAEVPESIKRVLVIGHNPTMHQLCLDLIGSGNVQLRHALAEKYPTGALAELAFSAEEWSELKPGMAELHRFVAPSAVEVAE